MLHLTCPCSAGCLALLIKIHDLESPFPFYEYINHLHFLLLPYILLLHPPIKQPTTRHHKMQELSNWGHVVLIWTLVLVLYIVLGLRTWALRNTSYSMLSPRGISTLCILLTVSLVTVVCAAVTWSLVGPLHAIPNIVLETLYNPDLPDSGNFVFNMDPRGPLETVFKVFFSSVLERSTGNGD